MRREKRSRKAGKRGGFSLAFLALGEATRQALREGNLANCGEFILTWLRLKKEDGSTG